ncbi:lipopolysaccharide transport periplasmic protein LptA [Halopseudomonas salegens]|uniref:Lipopolysaccharide export system protein LptA n=1 Tax=Halopseudomonas salegens TaxID=1434072 RepID=A0A1H2EB25_9GAMM|nr:lipopolysaccharide transport periplasmic protein LptA [Halopseudomonas salegens]SDT92285.1 lipopolysaccharide export system protein LptA [Halopseudomonas salegens]
MRSINTLLLATCLLASPIVLAVDSQQPINIQADSATLDDARNSAVYRGDVIVTQGSMRLTGSQVTLSMDSNGEVSKLVSTGSPATWRQDPPDGRGEINARAQTIEYHADAQRVVLIERSHLDQAGDTFSGDLITYDINRRVVDAGQRDGANGSDQRIEITIQPRNRDGEN